MKFLLPLQTYIQQLEDRKFIQYSALGTAAFILIIMALLYYHYRTMNALLTKVSSFKIQRELTQDILEENARVQKQKERVETLLAQEKNFKINQYFDTVLKELGIISNKEQEKPREEETIEGYKELILDVRLDNLNMKQVAELLEKIEKKDRIYIKEVTLNRNTNRPAINVEMSIATLEKKESNLAE